MDEVKKTYVRQREFLRVRTSIPINVVCLTKDGKVPEGIWVRGKISEIGGGGARIEAPVDMAVDDAVCIKFRLLDTEDEMRLYARIVAVLESTEGSAACIKFVGISENERGRVLRFLFREQIRRIKDVATQGTPSGEESGECEGRK
jgi:c-di-GMP-binding flagellar brake protein YcgR